VFLLLFVFTYSSCGLHVFLLPFELVFNLSFIFNLISDSGAHPQMESRRDRFDLNFHRPADHSIKSVKCAGNSGEWESRDLDSPEKIL